MIDNADNADDAGPAIRFTDEEAAFLRHVRFGELPPRVLPDDRVESIEHDSRNWRPDPAVEPDHGSVAGG